MAAKSDKPNILMYKNKPFVRQGDVIFYGNPDDKYIVSFVLSEFKTVNDTKVAWIKEVLDALNKGAEADNYYYFTGREETKLDYLVNPNSECYINLYYGNSHSGENLMCSLNCYNPTDDYLNLEDCTLIEVKCSESYSSSATAHCFTRSSNFCCPFTDTTSTRNFAISGE